MHNFKGKETSVNDSFILSNFKGIKNVGHSKLKDKPIGLDRYLMLNLKLC